MGVPPGSVSHWLPILSCSEIIYIPPGSGVGLLIKETLNVNSQITDTFESFEYIDARFRSLQGIRILVIYRPPGRSCYDLFYENFSKLRVISKLRVMRVILTYMSISEISFKVVQYSFFRTIPHFFNWQLNSLPKLRWI